ncbi:PREDICTED: taste receptor type 2 member 43-like, partial [Galeopterus variegatus]|uniref:Taste receptor type 2 member 43-like n=1 Tax=Galeopterus variegatus TaxID=482537 RepID=A0ABM0Q6A3_GALVR
LLLIGSLCKHLKKMQLHGKGSQDPSTQVHIKALQTVVSFLLLFAIYFLSVTVAVWNSHRLLREPGDRLLREPAFMFWEAVAIVYHSSHSFILIWGNKKLKQTFLSVFWQLRCWLKGQKPSTP